MGIESIPKQIARQLGMKPAEVTATLKALAETEALARAARGELAPIERCLTNENAEKHFFDPPKAGWLDGTCWRRQF